MARKTKAEALITRERLIDAAIGQFALKGFASTTLTDIADAAGVTRGAVYWHFDCKVQLFNEMWREQMPLRDIIEYKTIHNEKENALAWMREMFICALQYIAKTPKQRALMQILYHKCEFNAPMMAESEIRQRICFSYDNMRYLLGLCIQQRSLPADTNIELALVMLQSFFSGVLKNWLLFPERVDLYPLAPVLVDNILATLRPVFVQQPAPPESVT